ncbi:squalene synthase HpnC [Kingella negevensis]|uniref:All-trans-phytoene synthase n=1 Tax=Kingella negevensis TaxID=1522312 RepID=A0A238HJ83_9NEIS|nr:squalene synthase HpnC [Kingella negevensis]MDK4679827.1 squalene synthase HpnC [Kingella negevensis]MDK4682454.1 squalene synthase HpnC [Kingella negevensis]MDK4684654.1 squalene synthase HpnC [Kingella negevensis]MDK4690651.1 squalene synthase HpnC [Kingella negevensis]MDK4692000.1 squalene synthase HpnC [Kingella negevensis]
MTTPNHYENFPVGSIILPRRLRRPIHAVYAFARTADDIADEGNVTTAERQAELQKLIAELDKIAAHTQPETELMRQLNERAIQPFRLPLQPFYDLLSAFSQDTEKTRYQNFGELIDYARRSANPVGRIMLHLYGETSAQSIAQSDGICTALQLINFWQDVGIDWQKNRVYLPQDDLAKFGVTESDIAANKMTPNLRKLLAYECDKAHKMLRAGSPLGKTLRGRLGFELRMIILGGDCILQKLAAAQYDVFSQRPVLEKRDWLRIIWRAIIKK